MKHLLLTMGIVCAAATRLFSQTATISAKDPAAQKFFFPATLFSDSIAFEKAVPSLARYVLAGYTEKNKKRFFQNAALYHLLTGNYAQSMALVDSVHNAGDATFGIDVKSYAAAKMQSDGQAASFNEAFKKEFTAAYTPLSFRKKVYLAFLDSSQVNRFRSDYWDLKEKLRKAAADSLGVEEATELADKYALYKIYTDAFPLMSPQLNAPQYSTMYPAIKSYKWAGVAPVKDIDERPDPTMQYKLLIELTSFGYKDQDSAAKYDVNPGLGEVGRRINLHEAAGIPRKNMHVVVVVHAGALYALLNNDQYKKKYGVDNPNLKLINELQHYGVSIIACGQAMTFLRLEKEDLVPNIKQALTAQTVLSTYQLKNYVYYDLSLRE
jgi:intracellular sulfur oxidation DsrE/DsrF family protein